MNLFFTHLPSLARDQSNVRFLSRTLAHSLQPFLLANLFNLISLVSSNHELSLVINFRRTIDLPDFQNYSSHFYFPFSLSLSFFLSIYLFIYIFFPFFSSFPLSPFSSQRSMKHFRHCSKEKTNRSPARSSRFFPESPLLRKQLADFDLHPPHTRPTPLNLPLFRSHLSNSTLFAFRTTYSSAIALSATLLY